MKCESTGSQDASRRSRSIEWECRALSAGFTLLETLAALTVLAIAFAGLFEANTLGLRTAGAASSLVDARLFAEGLLADAANTRTLRPVNQEGREGRFSWAIHVDPELEPWASVQSKRGWKLYRVRVVVGWEANRKIELSTLRLTAEKKEPQR